MASREWFVQRLIDLKISAMFLTRLPVPHSEPVGAQHFFKSDGD